MSVKPGSPWSLAVDIQVSSRVDPLDILFIHHDAGLTGASMVLLHFQRWLQAKGGGGFANIVRTAGPLATHFQDLGELLLAPAPKAAPSPSLPQRLVRRISKRGARPVDPHAWAAEWERRPVRLFYSNTVTNGCGPSATFRGSVSLARPFPAR